MWRIRRGKQQGQRDSESGATAVEFAGASDPGLDPLGIFDIGNLFFKLDVVNNAARQRRGYLLSMFPLPPVPTPWRKLSPPFRKLQQPINYQLGLPPLAPEVMLGSQSKTR